MKVLYRRRRRLLVFAVFLSAATAAVLNTRSLETAGVFE